MSNLRTRLSKKLFDHFCDNHRTCNNIADFILSDEGLEMIKDQYECDIYVPGAIKIKEKQ